MKTVISAVSALLVAGALGVGAAQALPRIDGAAGGAPVTTAAATVEKTRIVCGWRRCFRTGYYRPYYGYYRPYYYRPHIGVGIGPFGVGIY